MKRLWVGLITILGITIAQGASISGTVTNGTTGEPLRFAIVVAENLTHPLRTRVGYSDHNGHYTIRNLHPGDYFVRAFRPGFRPIYYNGDTSRSEADTVTVAEGATIDSINFTLYPWSYYFGGAVVSGVVTDEGTGNPVPHAFVFLRPVDSIPHTRFFNLMGFTDTTGTYAIRGVPAGRYIAVSFKPGYFREYYQNVSTPDSADTLVLTENDTLEGINFSLSHFVFSAITGTVTDEQTSQGIKNAAVLAVKLIHGRPIGWRSFTRTDSTGNYTLGRLIPGNYIVVAKKFGYYREFYQNASVIDSATPVAVPPGDTVGDIDFTLTPWQNLPYDTASVSGTVYDQETGMPIVGAKVRALFRRFPFTIAVRTDSLGNYRIPYLPAGDSVILVAYARGYIHEFYSETPYLRDATPVVPPASSIDFTLSPRENYGSGGVMGLVSSGKSVTGLVIARNIDTYEEYAAPIDESGSYIIENMPPGEYEVSLFTLNGESIGSDTIRVEDSYVEKDFQVTSVEENSGIKKLTFPMVIRNIRPDRVKVEFSLPTGSNVIERVYDVSGRVVKLLNLGYLGPGTHTLEISGLRTGVYFVNIKAGNMSARGRFIILR